MFPGLVNHGCCKDFGERQQRTFKKVRGARKGPMGYRQGTGYRLVMLSTLLIMLLLQIVNPKGEMKGSAITGPVGKEAAELWPVC